MQSNLYWHSEYCYFHRLFFVVIILKVFFIFVNNHIKNPSHVPRLYILTKEYIFDATIFSGGIFCCHWNVFIECKYIARPTTWSGIASSMTFFLFVQHSQLLITLFVLRVSLMLFALNFLEALVHFAYQEFL